MSKKLVLITGSNGMIGSKIVSELLKMNYSVLGIDYSDSRLNNPKYKHLKLDLTDSKNIKEIVANYDVTHMIHLAALAHKENENDFSWDRYYLINVECSKTMFEVAAEKNIPIMFSSTADVYGITSGVVTEKTKKCPIGNYAKTKYEAENLLIKTCRFYTIMRFAPVYTPEIKRDIQKRYYIKYPNIAYKIGDGIKYEVLNINKLTKIVMDWVEDLNREQILNVYDEELLSTREIIKAEKVAGRAKYVVRVPKYFAKFVFACFRVINSKSMVTFMLSKAVNPIRFR